MIFALYTVYPYKEKWNKYDTYGDCYAHPEEYTRSYTLTTC